METGLYFLPLQLHHDPLAEPFCCDGDAKETYGGDTGDGGGSGHSYTRLGALHAISRRDFAIRAPQTSSGAFRSPLLAVVKGGELRSLRCPVGVSLPASAPPHPPPLSPNGAAAHLIMQLCPRSHQQPLHNCCSEGLTNWIFNFHGVCAAPEQRQRRSSHTLEQNEAHLWSDRCAHTRCVSGSRKPETHTSLRYSQSPRRTNARSFSSTQRSHVYV